MKNSTRTSRNYVLLAILLQGVLLTILLVGLKILTEHTSVGRRPESFAFATLHSVVAPFSRNKELPIVVVDLTDIKEKNGQIIDLVKLKEIMTAIADQSPRAIAVDVILNPKDITKPKKDGSTEPTVQQIQEYYDFLDFCQRLRAEKKVPIFLGVGMMSGGIPAEWLGQEKYKDLAATAMYEGEATRIPVWLKVGSGEKLFSLSASLARAYRNARPPRGLSWAIETTEGELPATQQHLEQNIEYAEAVINYNTLGDIRGRTLFTLSRSSVNEAAEKFQYKMVLLGDGTMPDLYVHACGAYTLAQQPLYEMKLPVRFAADICLSLMLFGGLVVHRRKTSKTHRAIIYLAGLSLLGALLFVNWLGLLWLDFVLVAVALVLHVKLAPAWSKHSPKRRILFLAANPTNASRIQTDKEHRVIKAEMARGSHRDAFEFLPPQFAVTISELLRAMNGKPNIVHFSGHGDTDGITITRDDNQSQLLTGDVLERLFNPLKGVTEIVVLNSCYSALQAEAISSLGMYVVGNNLPVGDQAAISFAKGLYNGLSEGKAFADAVNDARIVVMTETPSYAAVVEVWEGGNKLSV